MNIIICGAGEVGRYAAEVLGAEGHSITVIDLQRSQLDVVEEALDIRSLQGNGAHADVLLEAGCANADLFLAATSSDEINLLSASIASGVGAGRSIARVHHSAYFEGHGLEYARHLGVDHLVCPEYTTAVAIAQTLRNPGALAVEQFARGRIEMQRLPVSDRAPAIGRPLTQVGLPGAARVAAVERDGEVFIAGGDTIVQSADIVTLIGDVETFEQARLLFHNEQSGRNRVVVMGGTPMGVWLSRALRSRAFAVRLFETDRARCLELAEKLNWITVLRADPTDPTALDEEHVQQADAFVALTNDDEHNILAAARAKSMGASKAIAVLQRPTYLHLLEHVGIDRAFSPRVTVVNQIVRMLRTDPVRHLASVAEGVADVYEAHVSRHARDVIDRPLRDVAFPDKVMVAAIQRGASVRVPGAEDAIAAGDVVVLIGPAGLEKTLRKIFVTGTAAP